MLCTIMLAATVAAHCCTDRLQHSRCVEHHVVLPGRAGFRAALTAHHGTPSTQITRLSLLTGTALSAQTTCCVKHGCCFGTLQLLAASYRMRLQQ
jgi:hypothetical protein